MVDQKLCLPFVLTLCMSCFAEDGGGIVVDNPLERNGTLHGAVVADDIDAATFLSPSQESTGRSPVAEAAVIVHGDAYQGKTTTDASGAFMIELPPGHYNVIAEIVRQDGKKFLGMTTADVTEGTQTDLSEPILIKQAGAVYGGAKLADSETHQAITVLVRNVGIFALTNELGAYSLPAVPVGTHEIVIDKIGYRAQTILDVVVKPGEVSEIETVTLEADAAELVGKGVIRGSVRNQGGTPVASALISIKGLGVSTISGPDGNFELLVDPNAYVLIGIADGFSSGQQAVAVAANEIVETILVLPQAANFQLGLVKGQIVSGATGSPLSSALVVASPAANQTYSGVDGNFSLNLPGGCYTLNFALFGFEETQKFVCVNNAQTVQVSQIALYPTGAGLCIESIETCDGLDNDCDGAVDELASCSPEEENPPACTNTYGETSDPISPTISPSISYPNGNGHVLLDPSGRLYYVANKSDNSGIELQRFEPTECGEYTADLNDISILSGQTDIGGVHAAIDSGSHIHIAFTMGTFGTDRSAYYMKTDSNGSVLIDPVAISNQDYGYAYAHDLVVDANDDAFVAYADQYKVTFPIEADAMLAKFNAAGNQEITAQALAPSFVNSSFPQLALDSSGNLHVVMDEGASDPHYLHYTKLSATGTILVVDKNIPGTSGTYWFHQPAIAVDSGDTIHILGNSFDSGAKEVRHVALDVDGEVLVAPQFLSVDDNFHSTQTELFIDAFDNIYAFWHDYSVADVQVQYTVIDSNGDTVVPRTFVTNDLNSTNYTNNSNFIIDDFGNFIWKYIKDGDAILVAPIVE